MEPNINHVTNKLAKMIRQGREYAALKRSRSAHDLMNIWTLEWAEWLKRNDIDPTKFIERSGYVDHGN